MQIKSESLRTRSADVQQQKKSDAPVQAERTTLPFPCIFVLSWLSVGWSTCIGEDTSSQSTDQSNANLFQQHPYGHTRNNVLTSCRHPLALASKQVKLAITIGYLKMTLLLFLSWNLVLAHHLLIHSMSVSQSWLHVGITQKIFKK